MLLFPALRQFMQFFRRDVHTLVVFNSWPNFCPAPDGMRVYPIVQNAHFYMYLHMVHKHFFIPRTGAGTEILSYMHGFESVLRTKFSRKIRRPKAPVPRPIHSQFIHLQVRLCAAPPFSGARSQQIIFSIKIGTGGKIEKLK